MTINFIEIRFKNFMSFGNVLETFKFNSGLTHITGENGSGKSTISGETLSFVLFGKPYRKIKIGELVNRVNKKNCIVEVDFIKNDVPYTITRSIKPNKLKIVKDGVEISLKSTSKLIQDEIDNILGIDYNGFRQIVSVANNNNKQFIALSASEKRKIIENIFDLEMISEANKLLKQDRYDLKIKLATNETSLVGIETTLKGLHEYKNKMDTILKSFNNEKETALATLTANKKVKTSELTSVTSTLHVAKDELNKYDSNEINKISNEISLRITELTSGKGEIMGVLKKLSTDVTNLNTTDTCPICKTNITDEHRKAEIAVIGKQVKIHLIQLENYKADLITTETEQTNNSNLLLRYNDARIDYDTINTQIKNFTDDIDVIKADINKKKAETIPTITDDDIDELNSKIKTKLNEHKLTKDSVAEINTKLSIIDITEQLFSDKGIKSEYYSMIVPILNEKLNEYISQFELPITIVFDNFLEYQIKSIQQDDINYFSFSKGEKKKIDISIMLSFIHMSKMISNWDCNLLFFDEVLDNGVDSNSLDSITSLVKDVTVNNSSNNSVYVVSHRDINKDIFDHSILFENISGFSKISYT